MLTYKKTKDMYYKVEKGSLLFDELKKVKIKMKEAKTAAAEIVKKVGLGTVYRPSCWGLAGGISAFCIESGKPKGWRNAYSKHQKHSYMPSKTKANAALLSEIAALPVVDVDELNKLINYDSEFGHPGFSFQDEYVLFHINKELYEPVNGMVEILSSEYNKLSK